MILAPRPDPADPGPDPSGPPSRRQPEAWRAASRYGLRVTSDDATSFADLGLSGPVLAAVQELGYETPTPIQAATIPALLAGRDVVGLAQTGTGKTAAFALPILSRLDRTAATPQVLVLAPTRELAVQVSEAFERYAGDSGARVLAVYGGQGYAVQLSALRRGVSVVVGTPGRIMDHLDRGNLDLSALRFLVLDEADEMLNMGFAEDVEKILAGTPDDKQVALFSATMPPAIRRLAARYLHDPVEVTIAGRSTPAPSIRQRHMMVAYPQKVEALSRVLEVEQFGGVIVFVRTKNETETVAEKLRARGFSAAAINGDVPQQQRERTIEQLKSGALDILVATDVAARGLDVERISHVVNFDIPTDTESYVHRIGRTGRAGRSGEAISFVTPRERHLLRSIEHATGAQLAGMGMPSAEEVNATRLTRFDDAITAALDDGRLDFFRDVITHYVVEYDVPEADVAAALAIVMQGEQPLLLEPDPEPTARAGDDRPRRPSGDGGPLVRYRLAVGRAQRVQPRQIVEALANEAGLRRDQIGRIEVRAGHTLVELPAELPSDTWAALRRIRIAGVPADIAVDSGPPGRGAGRNRRGDRPFEERPHRPRAARHRPGDVPGPKGRAKKPRW